MGSTDDKLQIFEQAAEHFAAMAGGEATGADRDALAAWLLADPRHAEAYANVERLWDSAGELPALQARGDKVVRRLSRRDLGKGAGAVACAYLGWRYLETHPFADLSTGKGERRTERLPDGSTVELSAGTRLSFDFDGVSRGVTLHGGDAFFAVAPDRSRPFVVRAGASEMRALGTAFGAGYDGEAGRLVVTEHAVALRLAGSRLEVTAGAQASFSDDGLGAVEAADPAGLSWREGRLTFVRTPLGDVAAAVNRWREGRIVVLDSALAARPVTLIVDLARLETVLPRLAEVLPLKLVNVTRWLTLVLPAD